MGDESKPKYVSRAGVPAKKPGGGKDALKLVHQHRFFNAHQPVWKDGLGWIGWLGEEDGPDTDPRMGGITTILQEAVRSSVKHDGVEDWGMLLNPWGKLLEPARLNSSTPYFMHYWLSRIVEWHGYAVFAAAWKKAELASRGTELTYPYRQRIEEPDGKRFTAADKVATATELAWTSRWP